MEPYRSQGAKLIFIADAKSIDKESAMVHLVSFSSNIIRRVCRSTVQAETYNLQNCVEYGDLVRAAVCDARGSLERSRWEASAAGQIHLKWFTDCRSTFDALQRPVQAKMQDKRLGIEVASMRQSLWRRPGGDRTDPRTMEQRPTKTTDTVLWIDTAVMPADPLTKSMKSDFLRDIIEKNFWDFRQPAAAKAIKERKQALRSKGGHEIVPTQTTGNKTGHEIVPTQTTGNMTGHEVVPTQTTVSMRGHEVVPTQTSVSKERS